MAKHRLDKLDRRGLPPVRSVYWDKYTQTFLRRTGLWMTQYVVWPPR